MPAPRTPNTPVQVLRRPSTRRDDVFTSKRPIEERREGLVGSGGRPGTRAGETLKNTNGPAKNSVSELSRRSSFPTLPLLHQPTSVAVLYTAAVQKASSASTRPEGGARMETESLPGQNRIKPNLHDAQLDAPKLPGVNQDTSNMGNAPQPILPAAVANGLPPSPGPPAMMVDKPLPGQNQIMPPPSSGSLFPGPPSGPPSAPISPGAGPPGLPPPAPVPSAPVRPAPTIPSAPSGPSGPPKSPKAGPLIAGPLMPPTMPGPAPPAAAAPPPPPPPPPAPPSLTTSTSTSSTSSRLTSTITTLPTTSKQTSTPVSSSSLSLSSVTSFVTLTRPEEGKGDSLPTLAPPSIVSPTTTAAPQAIAVGQSLTVVFSSASAIADAFSTATDATGTQDGVGLHPMMRTMLIIFTILGVLSLIIAVIACTMVRAHRRRGARQQNIRSLPPSDVPNERIGVTTHITAEPNNNPFLTASEKAIIDTASTDGASQRNVNNSSRLSDAVSSFIEKSRSLTYKISP